jgi:hypothetical protein
MTVEGLFSFSYYNRRASVRLFWLLCVIRTFHYKTCLAEPLKNIPEGNWFCGNCQAPKPVRSKLELVHLSSLTSLPDVTEQEDDRKCSLCHHRGHGITGDLLYAAYDIWVHKACAYWAFSVREEMLEHLLFNVLSAIRLGSFHVHCDMNDRMW